MARAGYIITITNAGFSISAATPAEAVRKVKVPEALRESVTFHGPEGEPVELQMLGMQSGGNKLDLA